MEEPHGREGDAGMHPTEMPGGRSLDARARLVVEAVRAVLSPTGRPLSRRQQHVVVSRFLGLGGKATAAALGIDARTLQGYVVSARDRLGWSSLDAGTLLILREIGGDVAPMLDAIVGEPDVVGALLAEVGSCEIAGARRRP